MSDKAADRSSIATRNPLKRRGLLIGAGAVGATVLAAKVMPNAAPVATTTVAAATKVADPGGGYQVTDHVLRYYETTRA